MSSTAAARTETGRNSSTGRRSNTTADPAAGPIISFHRFLPYWAVLQTDLRQTAQSWLFSLWMVLALAGVGGFFLYRVGVQQQAGLVQAAAVQCGEALRAVFLGSVAVAAILGVAAISSERGSAADAVLARGISRHQYFLARQHARVLLVILAFAVLGTITVLTGTLLFRDSGVEISLSGAVVAIGLLCLLLAAVTAVGVVIGALANSAVLGIAIYWLLLYGGGLLLMLAPESWPAPERELARLRYVLQGYYSTAFYGRVALATLIVAGAATLVGLIGFSRKDV
ncbi:MAG: ABC transporter permease [Gemmataceae bacterium]|nr:ABC transporter permease [Gemmataceae bacterium]MCS7272014.1 ABC transporter permease [Gemmataceae bacterium]MDW8242794.1 ABC transporter permease [Thermogemmata sp.]